MFFYVKIAFFCKTISNQMSCNFKTTWDRGLGHISRTTIVYDQISILRPANKLLSTISEANRQYIYVIIVLKLIICNKNVWYWHPDSTSCTLNIYYYEYSFSTQQNACFYKHPHFTLHCICFRRESYHGVKSSNNCLTFNKILYIDLCIKMHR